jgi:hypothetical protein
MSETDTFRLEDNILVGGRYTSSDDDDDMSELSGGGLGLMNDIFMLGCCVFYCTTMIICITMIFVINKKTYCK